MTNNRLNKVNDEKKKAAIKSAVSNASIKRTTKSPAQVKGIAAKASRSLNKSTAPRKNITGAGMKTSTPLTKSQVSAIGKAEANKQLNRKSAATKKTSAPLTKAQVSSVAKSASNSLKRSTRKKYFG